MPKDKGETNAKIITCMREEFLTYGYERASLNRISKEVGITTAGLYKHFKSKEAMFAYLVEGTLNDLQELQSKGYKDMESDAVGTNPFSDEWVKTLVEFIYDHYEGVKLLVCCSAGSCYENFEEELIHEEEESNRQYGKLLRLAGYKVKKLTDIEWHILSTEYIHLVFEIVRHDMERDKAMKHMDFVKMLLYPGWKEIFGL